MSRYVYISGKTESGFDVSFSAETDSDVSGKALGIVAWFADSHLEAQSQRGAKSVTLKIPAGKILKSIELRWNRSATPFTDTTSVYQDFMFTVGKTPYEPYSGETFTQQLPEEVFGGVYEWDTGKLTVTAERIAATSKLNPGYGKHTNGMPYLSIGKGSALVANGLIASDRYRAGAWSDQNGRAYIPDSDSIIFTDNRFTDADTAYRIIDEERPEFICKLKTAREIQLQKHLVVAQKGITTVYGNAAQTEVTARRDPGAERRELEKRIAALEAAHTPTL